MLVTYVGAVHKKRESIKIEEKLAVHDGPEPRNAVHRARAKAFVRAMGDRVHYSSHRNL